jgi:hypothetical protein
MDLFGSNQYQVMITKTILRIWTLTSCMMCFLEEQRSEMDKPRATCGDGRRLVQKEHVKNFVSWLYVRFRDGFTVEQTLGQLAL